MRLWPEEKRATNRDPGFVNAATGDFRLRPDAEFLPRLPGFKPIPFEKIGLYVDELRKRLPVEPWRSLEPYVSRQRD